MTETEIERLVVRIVGDMSQYKDTLNRVDQETQNTTSSVLGTLGKIGLAAGAAATALLTAGVTWGANLAIEAEKAQISFEVMLGSADKAKKMVEDMRQFAASTPLETRDIQAAGKTLLQFGVAGQNVMPILRMIGDATGGDTMRFQQMSLAFGQMAASGRLMGQDLLQMINAGFNPLQAISQKTGKSMEVLKKEMEQGRISTKMVVEAFQTATSAGGQFDGMMSKQSETLSGLWSTLKDNLGMSMMQISQTLIEGFNVKGLLKEAIAFFGAFSDNYAANVQALTDWIKIQWAGVADWINEKFGGVAEGAGEVWSYITDLIGAWATKTFGLFTNFSTNVSTLWTWLGENWQSVLADMVNLVGVVVGNMANNFVVGIRMFVRLYTAFGGWVVGMFKRVFSFQVVDAILTGLIKAGEKIREWANAAWQTIKAIFTGKKAPGALDAFIAQAKGDFAQGMENANLFETFKGIIGEEAKNLQNPLEGFQSVIENGPDLKLDINGEALPKFVWKQGDEAKKGFDNAITGLADPVAKEAKKAKDSLKGLDAVAYNSADAVARVWEFRMDRARGTMSTPSLAARAATVVTPQRGPIIPAGNRANNPETLLTRIAVGVEKLIGVVRDGGGNVMLAEANIGEE